MDNKNNNADVTDGKEKKEIDYYALLSEYRFSKMDAAYNTVIFLSYVLCLVISFMYTTSPTGCCSYYIPHLSLNPPTFSTKWILPIATFTIA